MWRELEDALLVAKIELVKIETRVAISVAECGEGREREA